MRYFLLCLIKLYWLFIPADKRRTCIYYKSCSRHIYDITREKGLLLGIKAFNTRIKTCRPNHKIIYLDKEDIFLIQLSNGTTLQQNEISTNIVSAYRISMDRRN